MRKTYGEPTTEAPPPEKPKPIVEYFWDAREAFIETYGEFDMGDAKFFVSETIYYRLLESSDFKDIQSKDIQSFVLGDDEIPLWTVWGVVVSLAHLGHGCCLCANGNSYHFEIPDKPPKKPDPRITPTTFHGNYGKIDMGDVFVIGWLWDGILRLIDWLNNRTGASKPKNKSKNSPIIYGDVPQWFEDEIDSRPRNERESFYHPPPEVAHTPYEWIDGSESGRRYGAWRPVEGMATLADLFDDYDEKPQRPIAPPPQPTFKI